MKISIQNHDNPFRTQLYVRHCKGFLDRFLGLMFQPPPKDEEGIVLVQQRENRADAAIHMFFMRSDLTVVWVNSKMKVVDIKLAKRWRPYYAPQRPALYVLELSPSRYSEFKIGDTLSFKELID